MKKPKKRALIDYGVIITVSYLFRCLAMLLTDKIIHATLVVHVFFTYILN